MGNCFEGTKKTAPPAQKSAANKPAANKPQPHVVEAQNAVAAVMASNKKLLDRRRLMLKGLKELETWMATNRDVTKGLKSGAAVCAAGGVVLLFFCPPAGLLSLGYSGGVAIGAEAQKYVAENMGEKDYMLHCKEDEADVKQLEADLTQLIFSIAKIQENEESSFDSAVRSAAPKSHLYRQTINIAQYYEVQKLVGIASKLPVQSRIAISSGLKKFVMGYEKADKLGVALGHCADAERVAANGANVRVFASTWTKVLGAVGAAITIADAYVECTSQTPTEAAIKQAIQRIEKSISDLSKQVT